MIATHRRTLGSSVALLAFAIHRCTNAEIIVMSIVRWFAVLALLCGPMVATAQIYEATALGTLGGAGANAAAINNSGAVAGQTQPFLSVATVWDGTTITTLETPTGGSSSASGINNLGQVAGYSSSNGGPQFATVWNGTAATNLGPLATGANSYARGINDVGQVVGASQTFDSASYHATEWVGPTIKDLGVLGGYSESFASKINNAGTIVGYSSSAGPGGQRATEWTATGMTDLGTLGGTASAAFGINALGQVVGTAQIAGQVGYSGMTAAIWNGINATALGALDGQNVTSTAYSINVKGEAVGYTQTGSNTFVATVWRGDGSAFNLNSLVINPPPGVALEYAYGINDSGQIVAYGASNINSDYNTAYLLTPEAVPLPPSTWLMLSGFAGIAALSKGKRRLLGSLERGLIHQ
jgi:probable HAF family extracellular repeat protein